MSFAIEALLIILREILDTRPDGLSEHALLKELELRKVTFFDEPYFNSTLGLFQCHFLLFHCLYRLRDKLRMGEVADLNIHCLAIQIIPYRNTPSAYPALHDPLAAYYLDMDKLRLTDESGVLRMLENFWKRFASLDQRDEALAVMALTPSATYPEIRREYRRLAMRWHPDRGGHAARFHRLAWAMDVLRILYQEQPGNAL